MTKELQKDSLTILKAQVLFNTVVEMFEITRSRLGEGTIIVLHSYFESGIRNLQEGRVSQLTQDETDEVAKLK